MSVFRRFPSVPPLLSSIPSCPFPARPHCRRQVEGSLETAKKTAELMRFVLSSVRLVGKHSPDVASMLLAVRTAGSRLVAAKPLELTIGNVVRRVLHIVRHPAHPPSPPARPHIPLSSACRAEG